MGGQIAVMYDGMVTSLPLIKAGKLQPYALAAGPARSLRSLPDVARPLPPQLGYPDVDFSNWVGVVASPGQNAGGALAREVQTPPWTRPRRRRGPRPHGGSTQLPSPIAELPLPQLEQVRARRVRPQRGHRQDVQYPALIQSDPAMRRPASRRGLFSLRCAAYQPQGLAHAASR